MLTIGYLNGMYEANLVANILKLLICAFLVFLGNCYGQMRVDAVQQSLEQRGFISIKDFGAKGDGKADDTSALNAAIDAASRTAGTIFLPPGKYRFASKPKALGSGIRLVGAGSVGSTSDYGSYLIADYSESDDKAGFLTWDGSYSHNAGTGGGVEKLVVYKSQAHFGGTAIKLMGQDDSHRAGFTTISDVLVSGSGTWSHNLLIDGTCCTTKSGQGVRDIYINNFWAAEATSPGDSILFINAVQVFWHGGEVFPAGSGKNTGITITGKGSETGNSTNIFLTDVYVAGDLLISQARTVSVSGFVGGNVTINGTATNISVAGMVAGDILSQSGSATFATNQLRSVPAEGGKGVIYAGKRPQGISGGDLGASRAPDSGVFWLGSDGAGYIQRTAQGTLQLSLPISTGNAENTDLAGQLHLQQGAATYRFKTKYSLPPICVANDADAVQAVRATASTSEATFHGSNTHLINYQCVARK